MTWRYCSLEVNKIGGAHSSSMCSRAHTMRHDFQASTVWIINASIRAREKASTQGAYCPSQIVGRRLGAVGSGLAHALASMSIICCVWHSTHASPSTTHEGRALPATSMISLQCTLSESPVATPTSPNTSSSVSHCIAAWGLRSCGDCCAQVVQCGPLGPRCAPLGSDSPCVSSVK